MLLKILRMVLPKLKENFKRTFKMPIRPENLPLPKLCSKQKGYICKFDFSAVGKGPKSYKITLQCRVHSPWVLWFPYLAIIPRGYKWNAWENHFDNWNILRSIVQNKFTWNDISTTLNKKTPDKWNAWEINFYNWNDLIIGTNFRCRGCSNYRASTVQQ